MLINNKILDLVKSIENDRLDFDSLNEKLSLIIKELKITTLDPSNQQKYKTYLKNQYSLSKYPLVGEYAQSIDPLENEKEFLDAFFKYGMVVGKNVLSQKQCQKTVDRIHQIMLQVSGGKCDINNPSTYNYVPFDNNNVPILSRGFFEIYHDDILAQLRQSLRLYFHHVIIWGRYDLWTSYDRFGVKLPGHSESYGIPLHVDQNPNVHPNFKTTQGILALVDCPVERGTFLAVPGSIGYFDQYKRMSKNLGEYVELDLSDEISKDLQNNIQPIPLKAGDIVTWDSRMTHANTANVSDKVRYVGMVSFGPCREDDLQILKTRKEAYESGLGSNVREALMHASKKPRFTNSELVNQIRKPEQLNLLGNLLYGNIKYAQL